MYTAKETFASVDIFQQAPVYISKLKVKQIALAKFSVSQNNTKSECRKRFCREGERCTETGRKAGQELK